MEALVGNQACSRKTNGRRVESYGFDRYNRVIMIYPMLEAIITDFEMTAQVLTEGKP